MAALQLWPLCLNGGTERESERGRTVQVSTLGSLLIRTLILLDQGSTVTTSFNLSDSHKGLISHHRPQLGVRALIILGGHNSVHSVFFSCSHCTLRYLTLHFLELLKINLLDLLHASLFCQRACTWGRNFLNISFTVFL